MRPLPKKKITGTSKDGSRFMVLKSLILRMEKPEVAIRKPPTIESSVIKVSEMNSVKKLAPR